MSEHKPSKQLHLIAKINFEPGKVVCFPSKYQHFGAPPSNDNVLRITCALKLNLLGRIE